MSVLGVALVLGLLVGTQALGLVTEVFPSCDSVEAEAVAVVAQDYLNTQQTHGYKYVLNRIEDIKIRTKPGGGEIYLIEVDLLQTNCHVLDPTPVANCTVIPKLMTSVEADCDVALTNVNGVLSVTAFKCKSEESTEDLCLGCPTLLPLNDTTGLDLVSTSLATFNNNTGRLFALMEIGRMTAQIVAGGPKYSAEYVIVETNCTGVDGDNCQPLPVLAQHGFCQARGLSSAHTVDCKMFAAVTPIVTNDTVPAPPPMVHVHTGNLPANHGLRHHKLTPLYDPGVSGLLSAESAESAEVVPVVVVVPEAPLVQHVSDIFATVVSSLVPEVALGGSGSDTKESGVVVVQNVSDNSVFATVVSSLVPEVALGGSGSDTKESGVVVVQNVSDISVFATIVSSLVPEVALDGSGSDTKESGVVVVKREAPSPDLAPAAASPDNQPKPLFLVPRCPGKIKYF